MDIMLTIINALSLGFSDFSIEHTYAKSRIYFIYNLSNKDDYVRPGHIREISSITLQVIPVYNIYMYNLLYNIYCTHNNTMHGTDMYMY